MRAVVVRLFDHRQVGQVALDARLKVVVTTSLAVDDGQRLLAPGALATRARVTTDLGRSSRPFHPRNEKEGASEKHEGNHAHRLIVVRGLRGRALASDTEDMFPRDVPLALLLVSMAWMTVARAVLVFAQKLPPTCQNCGLKLERRYLGESVCDCHH
jgi:hypothetical protein